MTINRSMDEKMGACVSTRFLCPWDFTGKNNGVGCHSLLQGIFPTPVLNLGLLHFRQFLTGWSSRDHGNKHTNTHTHSHNGIFSSVQFSHSVVSGSLRPHESQHARPTCPSPIPGVHSDSRPLRQWCHPGISSSGVPFSTRPHSLPRSKTFPMSQLFAWVGQSTGVSALASFFPKKSQGWSPSEWTGWISLQSKGLSRVFSNTTVQKHQFFSAQPSSQSKSHIHTWPQEKP